MAGLALALAILAVSTARVHAYSERAHDVIVRNAVDFVLAERTASVRYSDQATGQSDYRLLVRTLGAGSDDGVRRAAAVLARSAAETDSAADVVLKFPGWGWWGDTYGASRVGVSFTVFSHFVNVQAPGVLWPFNGYYYGWVDQNQRCSDPSAQDVVANFFLANTDAEVDTTKSDAAVRYRDPLKAGATVDDYKARFGQKIRYVQFWPLTNLAAYWLREFVRSPPSAQGTPARLPWLGPVLHAAADATVPYHASGLSGCGHGAYEDMVERLSLQNLLYDRGAVRRNLTQGGHLKGTLRVEDIVTGSAQRAGRFCACSVNACDCPVAGDEKAAKELVNLATATTVTVLRKALTEWERSGGKQVAVGPRPAAEPRIVVTRYGAFGAIPDERRAVAASDRAVVQTMEDQLTERLAKLKGLVASLETGHLREEPFRQGFESAVADVALVVGKFPSAVWNPFPHRTQPPPFDGLPPSREPRIEFRLPSLEEIRSPASWKSYRQARQRFFDAYALYDGGVVRAAIEGHLKRTADARINETGRTWVANLKGRQEALIKALRVQPAPLPR